MRVFSNFNQSNNGKCPICQKNDDKETVLIGIVGTQKGGIMEAKQYHLDCLELGEQKHAGQTIIFQIVDQSF